MTRRVTTIFSSAVHEMPASKLSHRTHRAGPVSNAPFPSSFPLCPFKITLALVSCKMVIPKLVRASAAPMLLLL